MKANLKKNVNIQGLDYALIQADEKIQRAFQAWFGAFYVYTITSAKDGQHSKYSVHYNGKAIDVRINDLPIKSKLHSSKWWEIVEHFAFYLAYVLGGGFCLVLEKTHIHIQIGYDNIIGKMPGKNLYIKKRA